jgi:predicted phage terminase large subunit-like protein
MTRLAPVHLVFINANRWHEDDLVGKIQKANDPDSEQYDPDFPVFEIIECPAEVDGQWLFPERFDETWYRAERAFAGSYGWESQFQQQPVPRKGAMLQVTVGENIHIVDNVDDLAGDNVFEWGVDLASSEKELDKSDPDYTHGTLAALRMNNGGVPSVYIKDVFEIRETALTREDTIKGKVQDSGAKRVYCESVGAYKDAYILLKNMLSGIAVVEKVTVQRDIYARASHLEPIFEAGNVYIQRGEWNKRWLHWMQAFGPGSTAHDDAIASLLARVYKKLTGKGRMTISR